MPFTKRWVIKEKHHLSSSFQEASSSSPNRTKHCRHCCQSNKNKTKTKHNHFAGHVRVSHLWVWAEIIMDRVKIHFYINVMYSLPDSQLTIQPGDPVCWVRERGAWRMGGATWVEPASLRMSPTTRKTGEYREIRSQGIRYVYISVCALCTRIYPYFRAPTRGELHLNLIVRLVISPI